MKEDRLVAFAERVLTLLDQGSFVATYKYAVLLALMDLCMEKAQRDGGPPESVTTRQLAEKVIELYWPQTSSYRGRTLRQNSGRQARIISDICQFRAALGDPSGSLHSARIDARVAFGRLVRKVEWTLILMPLPRLQVVGGHVDHLIYKIGWGLEIERNRRTVTDYQRSLPSNFDNRILPWSRYPDNGIENLVLADAQCNRWKRDFLAARQHVSAWRTRNAEHESALFAAAAETSWPSHAAGTLGVARSIYLRLPSHARLWVRKDEFSPVGTEPLDAVLA